jgi:hypothetical protein
MRVRGHTFLKMHNATYANPHLASRWPSASYTDLLHRLSSYFIPVPHLHSPMDGQSQAICCHRVSKEAKSACCVHCTSHRRWSPSIVCPCLSQHYGPRLLRTNTSSHEFYEFNAWPQEIGVHSANTGPHHTKSSTVHKKHLLGYPEHASSQQRQPLDFPPFHQNILIQNSWDARENNGRIKLLLSEQLVSNVSNPGDLGFGVTKDIVCFSFQHAPRGNYTTLTSSGLSFEHILI